MQDSFDSHNNNDNRKYDYSGYRFTDRTEYEYISALVEPGSTVIDLGCGNGSLLQKLIRENSVTGCGLELAESGVQVCVSKGLNVKQGAIDCPLEYSDNQFDYAICNVTIQMVMAPEVLLKEMQRISKRQIVSFPNFGFYKNRIDMLLKGRMPKQMIFGYKWYSTGHVHQLSIKDFYELINDVGNFKILKHTFVGTNSQLKNYLMERFPNLFQTLPIFVLEKEKQS